MSDELKKCPLCGSKARVYHNTNSNYESNWSWDVECVNEECTANVYTACRGTREEAIEMWNTRAPQAQKIDTDNLMSQYHKWTNLENITIAEDTCVRNFIRFAKEQDLLRTRANLTNKKPQSCNLDKLSNAIANKVLESMPTPWGNDEYEENLFKWYENNYDALHAVLNQFVEPDNVVWQPIESAPKDEPVNIEAATFLYESLNGKKPPKGFFNKCNADELSHSDLVRIGARWLRYSKNCSIVIEEPATARFVKPDVLGFQMYQSFQIEVKVSKSDFLADKKKTGYDQKIADVNYYLVPADLVHPDEIRDNWGLIYARGKKWKDLEVVKEPKRTKESVNHWVHKVIFHSLLVKNNIKGHFTSTGDKVSRKKGSK